MQNMEYLTERDLKYFEKKEALGEAIIIRIDPGVLLSLDLDELFKERDQDQTLSAKELEDFFCGDRKPDVLEEPSETPEEPMISGIETNLRNIRLSADDRQSLLQLIAGGISDEELMEILQEQEN